MTHDPANKECIMGKSEHPCILHPYDSCICTCPPEKSQGEKHICCSHCKMEHHAKEDCTPQPQATQESQTWEDKFDKQFSWLIQYATKYSDYTGNRIDEITANKIKAFIANEIAQAKRQEGVRILEEADKETQEDSWGVTVVPFSSIIKIINTP